MASLGHGSSQAASSKTISAEDIALHWARALGCSEDEVRAVADAVTSAGERVRDLDRRRKNVSQPAPWRERARVLRFSAKG